MAAIQMQENCTTRRQMTHARPIKPLQRNFNQATLPAPGWSFKKTFPGAGNVLGNFPNNACARPSKGLYAVPVLMAEIWMLAARHPANCTV